MSVLNAFLATWSGARATFGMGSPEGGAAFDGSGHLRQLEADVQSAAPGPRWTGTASSAYGTANADHGRVLGQMAGLDQRLVTEVDRSAQVVAAGRRDLDAARKWVLDMAATVPQNQAGERMLLPVVKKGIGDVTDIINRSNSELNGIGGRIRGIAGEYQALGNQKFGGKEGEPDIVGITGDDPDEPKP
ncbi:MAG: EspA/EspE family type VII secretion system effector [Mycobacterium sp.]